MNVRHTSRSLLEICSLQNWANTVGRHLSQFLSVTRSSSEISNPLMSIRIIVARCSSLHERLCWVFRSPASYSRVFSLVSRPWHSWLPDLLRISTTLPRKFVGCILKTASTASFHILYKSTYTERRKNAGTNQRKVNPNRNVRKKYMNTGLLKHGFRVPASWGLKKMFKVSTLSFHAGMAGGRLVGLCLLPCLTAALYHDFVWNFRPELFENVDLHTRIHIWFMHDSTPPHFLLAFRNSWATCFWGNP